MKLKHRSDTSTTFGMDMIDIWMGRPTTSQDVFDETSAFAGEKSLCLLGATLWLVSSSLRL